MAAHFMSNTPRQTTQQWKTSTKAPVQRPHQPCQEKTNPLPTKPSQIEELDVKYEKKHKDFILDLQKHNLSLNRLDEKLEKTRIELQSQITKSQSARPPEPTTVIELRSIRDNLVNQIQGLEAKVERSLTAFQTILAEYEKHSRFWWAITLRPTQLHTSISDQSDQTTELPQSFLLQVYCPGYDSGPSEWYEVTGIRQSEGTKPSCIHGFVLSDDVVFASSCGFSE